MTNPRPGAPPQDPRGDLAQLGVTAQDGMNRAVGRPWNDAELSYLFASYSKAFDQQPLKGLIVIRESTFLKDPTVQAGTHASGGECPTKEQPTDRPHTHFYNKAFTNDSTGPWKVPARVRVPVHELGHLYIEKRSGTPSDRKDFDGAAAKLKAYKVAEFVDPVASVENDFKYLTGAIAELQEFGKGTDLTTIAAKRMDTLKYTRKVAARLEADILSFEKLASSKQGTVSQDITSAALDFIQQARALLRKHYSFAETWRILDYFIALAQKYGLTPFSDNADISVIEWFAETYALVCIDPTVLASAITKWFTSGFPNCPTKLMYLVLLD